jgi:hypothetical protein
MDDENDIDPTDKFAPDSEFKRKVNTLRTIAQAEQTTVASDTLEATARMKHAEANDATNTIKEREVMAVLEEAAESTTAVQRYQPVARVSWVQSLVNWFRRN